MFHRIQLILTSDLEEGNREHVHRRIGWCNQTVNQRALGGGAEKFIPVSEWTRSSRLASSNGRPGDVAAIAGLPKSFPEITTRCTHRKTIPNSFKREFIYMKFALKQQVSQGITLSHHGSGTDMRCTCPLCTVIKGEDHLRRNSCSSNKNSCCSQWTVKSRHSIEMGYNRRRRQPCATSRYLIFHRTKPLNKTTVSKNLPSVLV